MEGLAASPGLQTTKTYLRSLLLLIFHRQDTEVVQLVHLESRLLVKAKGGKRGSVSASAGKAEL